MSLTNQTQSLPCTFSKTDDLLQKSSISLFFKKHSCTVHQLFELPCPAFFHHLQIMSILNREHINETLRISINTKVKKQNKPSPKQHRRRHGQINRRLFLMREKTQFSRSTPRDILLCLTVAPSVYSSLNEMISVERRKKKGRIFSRR